MECAQLAAAVAPHRSKESAGHVRKPQPIQKRQQAARTPYASRGSGAETVAYEPVKRMSLPRSKNAVASLRSKESAGHVRKPQHIQKRQQAARTPYASRGSGAETVAYEPDKRMSLPRSKK